MAKGSLMNVLRILKAGLAVVVLLASLGLVTWRQSRALEVLERLDEIRQDASVSQAERVDLERTIQRLESRAWVVPEARKRLRMHTPDASELVILPAEVTS